MTTNDWGQRIRSGLKTLHSEERKGASAITRFMTQDLLPYIGMRMQEGALVWRPDSDEAVKSVIDDMKQAAECDSVKGVPEGSDLWHEIRRNAAFIARGVRLYQYCCVLADRHGVAADFTAKTPLFPVAWFIPEGRVRVVRSKSPMMLPLSGKEKFSMKLETETDEDEMFPFTVSEASIKALAVPKAQRNVNDDAPAPESLQAAVDATASMLARADYTISGDASDAFVSMLEEFIAASPANLALVAGIVDAAQNEPAAKAA